MYALSGDYKLTHIRRLILRKTDCLTDPPFRVDYVLGLP